MFVGILSLTKVWTVIMNLKWFLFFFNVLSCQTCMDFSISKILILQRIFWYIKVLFYFAKSIKIVNTTEQIPSNKASSGNFHPSSSNFPNPTEFTAKVERRTMIKTNVINEKTNYIDGHLLFQLHQNIFCLLHPTKAMVKIPYQELNDRSKLKIRTKIKDWTCSLVTLMHSQ